VQPVEHRSSAHADKRSDCTPFSVHACRHDALAKLCMDQAKQEFAQLFSGYSSNSTVRWRH